jgi:hypothetical protein
VFCVRRPLQRDLRTGRKLRAAVSAHCDEFGAHRAAQDQVGAQVLQALHGGRDRSLQKHRLGPDAQKIAGVLYRSRFMAGVPMKRAANVVAGWE